MTDDRFDGAGRRRRRKPCPECGKSLSMARAARFVDPGLSRKPWLVPGHNHARTGTQCRASWMRTP